MAHFVPLRGSQDPICGMFHTKSQDSVGANVEDTTCSSTIRPLVMTPKGFHWPPNGPLYAPKRV